MSAQRNEERDIKNSGLQEQSNSSNELHLGGKLERRRRIEEICEERRMRFELGDGY